MVREKLPEVCEFLRAIKNSPDYKRWGDIVGSSLETYMSRAIMNVRGVSPYDDKSLYPLLDARYKSDIPQDILKEAERLSIAGSGGDPRGLTYWNSAVEVWARMSEQYVYTKLGKVGISNPWLTHLSYKDEDTFMDQDYFEQHVMPIMERLFQRVAEF